MALHLAPGGSRRTTECSHLFSLSSACGGGPAPPRRRAVIRRPCRGETAPPVRMSARGDLRDPYTRDWTIEKPLTDLWVLRVAPEHWL